MGATFSLKDLRLTTGDMQLFTAVSVAFSLLHIVRAQAPVWGELIHSQSIPVGQLTDWSFIHQASAVVRAGLEQVVSSVAMM